MTRTAPPSISMSASARKRAPARASAAARTGPGTSGRNAENTTERPESGAPQVTVSGSVSGAEASAVLGLASAAASSDGVAPLSEHVLLHLKHGGDAHARDLLLLAGGGVS